MKPKVCVLKTDGTNCHIETQYSFNLAGAEAEVVHLASLKEKEDPATGRKLSLSDYQILALPGGFSYGDYLGSGRVFASDLRHFLGDELSEFVAQGKPVIGICNGFQVLVKYGLLPALNGIRQTTTLTDNASQRFRCDWVTLVRPSRESRCIWTRGIDKIDLPVAHGEGRFVAPVDLCEKLFDGGLVAFQYANKNGAPTMEYPYNPNGSIYAIAAICNPQGTVFGLMPHPERYVSPQRHPNAPLQKILGTLPAKGPGLKIFENAVEYSK